MARRAFTRTIDIPGWSRASRWGYDDVHEAYWVVLVPPWGEAVHVGPEQLLVTLGGLARAVEGRTGVPASTAYLALTA